MNETICGDYLNRKKFIDIVYNYIVNNVNKIEKPVCFGINGEWGQGKSWLLSKLEMKFKGIDLNNDFSNEEENKSKSLDFFVFKYNAWELDYYDDPLVGIIITLFEQLNEIKMLKFEKTLEEILKIEVKVLASICGEISKKLLGINVIESAIKINKKVKEFNDVCKIYNKTQKNSITEDIDNLLILLNKLSGYKPIIFMVDEIDRCLPEYAIKTLERLHHIFSKVENSFTIISTDEEQLKNSIQSLYGTAYSAKKYLEKFISFSFNLERGEMLEKEFLKKIKMISEKIGYDYVYSAEWDNINVFLRYLNAREKQLILDRIILSLNALPTLKNEYNDSNLLVGCILLCTLNYYDSTKKDGFNINNIDPSRNISEKTTFENILNFYFSQYNAISQINNENKLPYLLLFIVLKIILKEKNRFQKLISSCSYLNNGLKEEIEGKIKILEEFYEVNKILK